MGVEDLRKKGFTQKEIDRLGQERAEFLSPQKVSAIKEEIIWFLSDAKPLRLPSYQILVKNVDSNLPPENRLELLEKEASLLPRPVNDESEILRLTKSFTRIRILRELGFTTKSNPPFDIQANWEEEGKDDGKSVSFRFVQSPRQKHVFIVRTTIPKPNNLCEIRENLVTAPNKDRLKSFWKETLAKEIQSIPTPVLK